MFDASSMIIENSELLGLGLAAQLRVAARRLHRCAATNAVYQRYFAEARAIARWLCGD